MPVTMLVVGVGSIGERHLRCFQQQPGVEVALCEPHAERRGDIAARYGLRQSFASIDEAAQQTWDAAVVCTPAHLHVPHALALLDCARSLLIEKPLSTSFDDAARLAAACAGRTVGVAYVYRAHPALAAVRRIVASGELGQVCEITVAAGQHFPTFRPAYRDIYYTRRETGGGAIQDAATHLFDAMQHLVGRFDWVFCDAAHQALPGIEVEDTVHLTGRANGERVLASLALNQFMAPNETAVQINGDQGSARIEFHRQRFGVFLRGADDWIWRETPLQERDELFRRQAEAFLRSAAGDAPLLCSMDDALATLRVNVAALKSADTGQRVWITE